MEAREGDLIEVKDGTIFGVKGLVHPPRKIVALPRYVPDPRGDRNRGDIVYRKTYSLPERYRLVGERFPQYVVFDPVFGTKLCEVPTEDVCRHLTPIAFLDALRQRRQLDSLEQSALAFTESLIDCSGVDSRALGISGSILAQLHGAESDIDPIVYGEENCRRVHESLRSLLGSRRAGFRSYTLRELRSLYNFRSQDTNMPLEDFVTVERRKVLQGRFRRHDFFIRCLKEASEVQEHYGDVTYRRVGYGKMRAVVSRGDEAIFTPCRYGIREAHFLEGESDREVTAMVSFRGRFCEQAREGESVVAQGKIEECSSKSGEQSLRLLLGERKSDFMCLTGRTM